MNMRRKVEEGEQSDFAIRNDGALVIGSRLCVLAAEELKGQILGEAHSSAYAMHPGSTKMYRTLKEFYWWSGMKREVAEYVSKCLVCQLVKAKRQKPSGLLQPLPIPEWKWEHITMDFIFKLPPITQRHDSIWVVVDRLTKFAHFLLICEKFSPQKLAELFMSHIVSLHGVPVSIISDRDPRFTSRFWKRLMKELGVKLNLSTAFHLQTDGQSEGTIQTLEDILRSCVLQFKGHWNEYLPLAEFTYNNSYHSSIEMSPYEALYGKQCRTPLCWNETGERKLLGHEIVQATVDKVNVIRAKLKAAQDRQKSYADKRRKDLEFEVEDRVFLKLSPWKGVVRFGKREKLSPRYIGPFEIVERVGPVAYRLDLPEEVSRVHNVIHISMLRKYIPDPSHVLEAPEIELRDDLSYEEQPVQILGREEKELRNKTISLVKVLWRNHLVEEATWEREEQMRSQYPHFFQHTGTNFVDEIFL